VIARLLLALEEHAEILREIHGGIEAPREQELEGGDATVAALGEQSFTHQRKVEETERNGCR
jgi:hypothetical protein